MSARNPGKVVTFYSYKGGTGRSMALANTACILAQQGKLVLAIDWDLEAPGLHRYFQEIRKNNPSQTAKDDAKPGLIDLFSFIDSQVASGSSDVKDSSQNEAGAEQIVSKIDLDSYLVSTDIPTLFFVKAGKYGENGKFDQGYARRVTTFPWESLYLRSPWLISCFAENLASRFDYVLLDSRTGITDSSGICTMVMPDVLVVVFTPNQQSTIGAIELLERAAKYRRESNDLRPLLIFPLASRVDAAEPILREDWRFGSSAKRIEGYQTLFEDLFKRIYDLRECSLKQYFDDAQIQHIPRYAFGESIAVMQERTEDRLSLSRPYRNFVECLASGSPPWQGPVSIETALIQKQQAEQRVAELHSSVGTATKASYRKGILVTAASVVALLLIVAAIAIPNLLRSRMAANDATAVSCVRTIVTAEIAYSGTYDTKGFACSLRQLGPPPGSSSSAPPSKDFGSFIDSVLASGEKSGYKFELQNCTAPGPEKPFDKFEVVATPLQPGTTGSRSFCADESGEVKLMLPNKPCAEGLPLEQ